MDIYRENILDHYRNPRNSGTIPDPDASETGFNPLCGDRIKIQLKVKGGKLENIQFKAEGCAISIATASMLAEHTQGMSLDDLRKLSKDDILELVGISLSPTRLKCALLSLKTLQGAISIKKGG